MLVGAGLDADTVVSRPCSRAGVSCRPQSSAGQEQADVVAYVVSISSPSQ